MPKRKAKRPVGRPKKRSLDEWNSFIKTMTTIKNCCKQDRDAILEVFREQSPETTLEHLKKLSSAELKKLLFVAINKMPWIETEIGGLFELKELTDNFSLSNPELPELPELLDIIEGERKNTWQNATLYDQRKQAGKYAAMTSTKYAFRVGQLLREIREFSDGRDKEVQDWLAFAIALGRLSVAMQAVDKEPEFQEGRKAKLNRDVAAKGAIKEPKTGEEILAALKKYGHLKRTSAIEKAANDSGVGTTTFRKWMRQSGIE
jgi:hypothetical protein